MMKKILLTAMLAAVLVLPMEGVALANTPETSSSEVTAPVSDTVQVQEGTDYVPGDVPAQTGALEAMTPAIHGAILATLHHDLAQFDFSNTQLGWETLYNMLSLYGQMDERSEYVGEDLVMPVETVMDFSAALFPSFDALGTIPQELADRMTYRSEIDSYRLVCGNDSLAQIQLDSSQREGSGLVLTGSLVYEVEDTSLVRFQAVLQPRDNMFGYTITSLELV